MYYTAYKTQNYNNFVSNLSHILSRVLHHVLHHALSRGSQIPELCPRARQNWNCPDAGRAGKQNKRG